MKIHRLVEDTTKESKFEAGHGLSVYFKKDRKNFIWR